MGALLGAVDRLVAGVCKWVSIVMLLALFALLGTTILLRLTPMLAVPGQDELIEFLVIWIVMLTSLALWREGALYRVAMLDRVLRPAVRRALEVLIHLSMLALATILTVHGWEFARGSGETTPFLRLDRFWWYGAIPICGAVMMVYSVVWILRALTGRMMRDDATLLG